MKNVIKAPTNHSSGNGDGFDQADPSLQDQDDGVSGGTDLTPALIVLVVKAQVMERIMGPLTTFIRRHHVSTQAKIFSRVVC